MKTAISPQDGDAISRMMQANYASKFTKEPRCFRIVRFFRSGRKPRTIKSSLTETEAQAHCEREDTHGPGWFDGYDYMKGCRP